MSIVVRRSNKSLEISKSAWFLCRFLCRNLSEDNFEKVRDHISSCKGVKTRLRLSDKGVEIGYKPGHPRHFHHKIKYEVLPLVAAEAMIQDLTFINVLLCVFHVDNLPGLELEIIAFKFPDSNTVKRFQDICNILLGSLQQQVTYAAPGNSGNLTLMPSKTYHMGSLAPERWGSVDRLQVNDPFAENSEVSYGRSGRGVNGYGTVIPASEVQRRGVGATGRHHPHDVDDDGSVSSSGQGTFREATGSSNLGRGGASSSSNYPNFLRAESGSVVSGQSSGAYDDDAGGHVLHSNGVSLAYSRNRSRNNNNITLTSMDVHDGGKHSKDKRMHKEKTGAMTSTMNGRGRYASANDINTIHMRPQSVDPYQGRLMGSSSRTDIYQQQDAVSVRSQASYYLEPSFKKVYAPRSGRALNSGYDGSVYQDNRSRVYAGSEIRAKQVY